MNLLIPLLLVTTAASTSDRAIEVASDSMVLHPGSHTATATGHVYAHSARFEVHCDSGDAVYGQDPVSHRRIVQKMLLHGHVHLRRFSDGLIADSREAVYDADSATVVLTGDPVATRDQDTLHGERFEISTDSDTAVVKEPRAALVREGKAPVQVTADVLTILDGGSRMRFEQSVRVNEGVFSSSSDRLDAWATSGAGHASSTLRRLVSEGHVQLRRGKQRGWCGRAIYDVASTNLVMQEHPVVVQDGDTVRGRIITINEATGTAKAEGADMDLSAEHRP